MLPTVLMADRSLSSQQSSDKAPLPEEVGAFSLRGKRAVIVEDEGITQLQLRRILQLKGIVVVGLAANGQQAIDIVLETRPDVVLMDIRMPGMDGLEASRRILEQYRVCIVMLTAFSEEEYQIEAQKIGTCGYVIKPVTAAILLPLVEAALQKFSQS